MSAPGEGSSTPPTQGAPQPPSPPLLSPPPPSRPPESHTPESHPPESHPPPSHPPPASESSLPEEPARPARPPNPEGEPFEGTFEIKNSWEAAKDYDFIGLRGEGRKCNIIESIGHLVKSCLGGGIVAIHESYKTCGLWTALFLNIILGIFVSYCMLILAKSAQKMYGRVEVPKMTYPDLAQASIEVGPWPQARRFARCFRYAVDVTIGIDLFGSCCVYQVVIARTIKQLIENTPIVSDSGNPPIRVYILCLLVPCVLICMITTLKYLAPFSIVADIFIVIVALSTVYYAIKFHTLSPFKFRAFNSIPGLFEFMGVCVFSMEGVGVTLAVENSMKEPKKFPVVLVGGMSIVVAMVMTVGFFGYWGFGDLAKSPVTVNFPMETFPIVLKYFMALMIYVTFALNFWIPFELMWHYIQKKYQPAKFWLWERVYRAIFVCIITLLAIIFPNVSKFMGVLGSFCLSNMGFIFPALIELSVNWENPGLGYMKWRLFKFIGIFIFGVVMCIVGTYTNMRELILEVFYSK